MHLCLSSQIPVTFIRSSRLLSLTILMSALVLNVQCHKQGEWCWYVFRCPERVIATVTIRGITGFEIELFIKLPYVGLSDFKVHSAKINFFHLKYQFSLRFGAMTTMLSRVAKTLSPDPGYTPDHIGVSAQRFQAILIQSAARS